MMTESPVVCLTHIRWHPCLTGDHRYDSPNLRCIITQDPTSVDLLREFHGGTAPLEEVQDDFAYAIRNPNPDWPNTVIENEGHVVY